MTKSGGSPILPVIRYLIPVLVGALGVATPSQAFLPYFADGNPDAPLRWFVNHAEVVFDAGAPQEIVFDTAVSVTETAILQWSEVACAEGPVPFKFTFGGVVSGKKVGHFSEQENENLVIWVTSTSQWPHSSGVLAITTLTFDSNTGQIVDSDLELNDAQFLFSINAGPAQADLPNTVVHETGHFLGLDHSDILEATMAASAPLGETQKRDLHADDIAGYCHLYGADAPPAPEFIGGDLVTGQVPGAPDCGCHTTHSPMPWGPVLLIVLALWFSRLRRRYPWHVPRP